MISEDNKAQRFKKRKQESLAFIERAAEANDDRGECQKVKESCLMVLRHFYQEQASCPENGYQTKE